MGEYNEQTWFPLSDILNLFSMVVLTLGVSVLPVFGFGKEFMTYAFGLAMLLFVGVPFGLAGHYELYMPAEEHDQTYSPRQERVVIAVVTALAIAYVVIAVMREISFPYQEKIVIAFVAALVIACVVIAVMMTNRIIHDDDTSEQA